MFAPGSEAVEMEILIMQERRKVNKGQKSLTEDGVQSSWANSTIDRIMTPYQFHHEGTEKMLVGVHAGGSRGLVVRRLGLSWLTDFLFSNIHKSSSSAKSVICG